LTLAPGRDRLGGDAVHRQSLSRRRFRLELEHLFVDLRVRIQRSDLEGVRRAGLEAFRRERHRRQALGLGHSLRRLALLRSLVAQGDLVLVDAGDGLPGVPGDDGSVERRDEDGLQVGDGVQSGLGGERLDQVVAKLVALASGSQNFFLLSFMLRQNKLECLSMTHFIRLV
jgi:hypothetical protein